MSSSSDDAVNEFRKKTEEEWLTQVHLEKAVRMLGSSCLCEYGTVVVQNNLCFYFSCFSGHLILPLKLCESFLLSTFYCFWL